MSSLTDFLNDVANIKVEKPDNPYIGVSDTTVPLADIISVQGIYLQHNKEQKEKDAEIARLNEQVLSSNDMNTLTSQMQENIDVLTKKLEEMSKKLEEKGDSIALERYDELKNKFDDLQKLYDELASEKSKLEEFYNESLEKEKELSVTIEGLNADIANLRSENDNLSVQNKELSEVHDKLKGEYDTLSLEYEKLKSEPSGDVELTVDYIKSKGFTYLDFADENAKRFINQLYTIAKREDYATDESLRDRVSKLLNKLVFVAVDDQVNIIKNPEYYNGKCTSAEFFDTALHTICKGYTGSDMENFIFRPFAVWYGFDDMVALDSYLRNKSVVIDADGNDTNVEDITNDITESTTDNDTPNVVESTTDDDTDKGDVDTDTDADVDTIEVIDTDNNSLPVVTNVVFDDNHIHQLVYDAVLQCFEDFEFNTNINYITKIVAFACVSALHLTPFSCPNYFAKYESKRSVAITTDIMETILKGIFREQLERVKPSLSDDEDNPELEIAMEHMGELDEQVNEMLTAHESFYHNDLGDDIW